MELERLEQLKSTFEAIDEDNYKEQLELLSAIKGQKKKVKKIKKVLREAYIKRGMVKKIVAAWLITVPASALLSAIIFFVLKGIAI